MNIALKSIHIENFKGIKEKNISFSERTKIKGRNAAGKTTILDAVLWLLFGKNSQYVEKFDLRPLDSDGKPINFVDISVSAVFDIDGNETELKKTQKQNWVKHRGSEESVFQGNVNSYEIDGYPRSDKEFKEFVSGMIDENIFKILTNPTYFPSMKWKEQRDILMKFATTETDAEIAERLGGFDELLKELKAAPSTDAIQKKYATAKKSLEATLKELPVRIDELTKQKVDFDVSELELQKADIERRKAESKTFDVVEFENLKKQSMDNDFTLSAYCMESEKALKEERLSIENTISELNGKYHTATVDIDGAEYEMKSIQNKIVSTSDKLDALGKRYFELKETIFDASKWVFDENSTICSLCGQKLPEERISEIKADYERRKAEAKAKFESDKKAELKELTDEGNVVKGEIASMKARIATLTDNIAQTKTALEQITKRINDAKSKIANLPVSVDLSSDSKYLALVEKSNEFKAKIDEMQVLKNNSVLANSTFDGELAEINDKLTLAANNVKIDERISELQKEQFETSQQIANVEKMLYLLETFTRAKLEDISATINNHFKMVKFKLFDLAINGGITETCELTVNGVPYSDLNNGHRIVAGIDIACTLSEVYEKTVFMFADNAESINTFNIPEVKNQLICLYVTEDKDLVVENAF